MKGKVKNIKPGLAIMLMTITICFMADYAVFGLKKMGGEVGGGFGREAQAADYYVDKEHPNASDSNSGTESQPWLTIQAALDNVSAGDVVIVKSGVYSQYLRMQQSGTSSQPIVIKSEVKHGAIIDGSPNTNDFLVNFNGKSWITLDGFEIRYSRRYGVWVSGDNNTVQFCDVHHSGPENTVATGINVAYAQGTKIIGNEVSYSGWNGISIGTSEYCTVEYNYAHHNAYHNGINMIPNPIGDQYLLYGNNVRYNILTGNINGIYMRWQADNEVVGNITHDNSKNGIVIAYEPSHGGNTYQANTKIYNNVIINNTNNGINNMSGTHLTIKNNIIAYNSPSSNKYDITISSNATAGHVIDYNIYYDDVRFSWGSQSGLSFSQWQTASGEDSHSSVTDPKFKNVSNLPTGFSGTYGVDMQPDKDGLSIESGNAIDNGADLGIDYNGAINLAGKSEGLTRPLGNGWDIGAYEYISGEDTTPPSRSNPSPTGELPAGTTNTNISLTTNESSTCRYSTTANIAYASMTNTFTTTGGTTHSTNVSGLSNGNTYTYYVRAEDTAGNANTDDYLISFSVATQGGGDSGDDGGDDSSGGGCFIGTAAMGE